MRDIVRQAFAAFTDRFEGKLNHMYLDRKCLVTTGRGNLIDPMGPALVLPWMHADLVTLATQGEITDEWNHVKNLTSWSQMGGVAFARVTTLRMTWEAVDTLTYSKMDQLWASLCRRLPFQFAEQWPAACQLGALSMSWAMGPGFIFPNFQRAALSQDWAVCAVECKINEPGDHAVEDRNKANSELFLWANDPANGADSLPSAFAPSPTSCIAD